MYIYVCVCVCLYVYMCVRVCVCVRAHPRVGVRVECLAFRVGVGFFIKGCGWGCGVEVGSGVKGTGS